MEKKHFLTQDALEKRKVEVEELRTSGRREVAEKISRAKEVGGTDNNAEYDDAKREQSFLEGKIRKLESLIASVEVVNLPPSSPVVKLGSRVVVRDQDGKEERYTIVDGLESNPLNGKISADSPVGRSLLGKKAHAKVSIPVPAGTLTLHILAIE